MADFVEGFLSNYPEEIRAISRNLRSMAKRAMRGAQEFLYYDAINYSLTNSPLDRICYIRPLRKRVTLGFLFGRQLDDPHHLLQGIGKRARYVKVRTLEDTKNPALKQLVKAAWTGGADSVTRMKQLMRLRRAQLKRGPVTHSRTKRARRSRPRRR